MFRGRRLSHPPVLSCRAVAAQGENATGTKVIVAIVFLALAIFALVSLGASQASATMFRGKTVIQDIPFDPPRAPAGVPPSTPTMAGADGQTLPKADDPSCRHEGTTAATEDAERVKRQCLETAGLAKEKKFEQTKCNQAYENSMVTIKRDTAKEDATCQQKTYESNYQAMRGTETGPLQDFVRACIQNDKTTTSKNATITQCKTFFMGNFAKTCGGYSYRRIKINGKDTNLYGDRGAGPGYTLQEIEGACRIVLGDMSAEEKKASSEAKWKADGSTDECKAAVQAAYAKYGGDIQELEKKYGCSADKSTLSTTDTVAQVSQLASQTTAQTLTGIATGKVQNAAADAQSGKGSAGDVQVTAAHELGKAEVEAGSVQGAVGLGIMTMALWQERGVKNNQEDASSEIKAKIMGDVATHNKLVKAYTDDPTQANMLALTGFDKANLQGIYQDDSDYAHLKVLEASEVTAALSTKSQLADKAKAQMTQHLIQGGLMVANSAVTIGAGIANMNAAKEMQQDTSTNSGLPPLMQVVAGTPQGNVTDTSVAPPTNPQLLGDGAAAATAETPTGDQKGPAGALPPPLFGGGGNPGGLKDAPGAPSTGGNVGLGSTTGGGGGGAGNVGGGGGGDAGGGNADTASNGGPVEKTKFDSAGAGGNAAAFGAAGGGGHKRSDNTGMDINGLLSQFLPKQGEQGQKPSNDIVNFGSNRQIASAHSASDEDAGIMGPNSKSLFSRVNGTTVLIFQSGRVR